jgi:enoyl-[acyl-carrier-protein] reductase (NADH)
MKTLVDYRDKVVLVTGATRGIGLETALVFAEAGAICYLTYYLGSIELSKVYEKFEKANLRRPVITRCNAADENETQELLNKIKEKHECITAWIPNVSVAQLIANFDDYHKKSLFQSIEASAWPLFDGIKRINKTFGAYPKYAIGISSVGAERYVHNYDFMSASKNVLETLCKYSNFRLYNEDIRINVVRAGMVNSESLRLTFGDNFMDMTKRYNLDRYYLQPREVANSIFALCSGYLDAISGEIIRVDKGVSFFDTFMRIYTDMETINKNSTAY